MGKQDEYKEASRVEPYIKKAIQRVQEGDLVVQLRKVELKIFNGKTEFFISVDNAVLEKMVQQYLDENIKNVMDNAFEYLLSRNRSLLDEARKEAKNFIERE